MTAALSLTVAAWFASEISIGIRAVRRVGARSQDRLSGPALAGGLFLAVGAGRLAATHVPGATIPVGRTGIFWLGIFVALVGIVLRQYAVAALGPYFTTRIMTTPDQDVVETGPYRYVRHPSYSGLLLSALGVLLSAGNWLSLACFVLALPGFLYRIRVEEGALIAALGKPYRDYMARTKRLVPFVV